MSVTEYFRILKKIRNQNVRKWEVLKSYFIPIPWHRDFVQQRKYDIVRKSSHNVIHS
jgi:hypothetical protein